MLSTISFPRKYPAPNDTPQAHISSNNRPIGGGKHMRRPIIITIIRIAPVLIIACPIMIKPKLRDTSFSDSTDNFVIFIAVWPTKVYAAHDNMPAISA
ncbi:MAG: hypothetical protein NTY80_00800 [candidate division SR1 bacterium]|nr:hypothetical protein [candidate division SR1 bacterium]